MRVPTTHVLGVFGRMASCLPMLAAILLEGNAIGTHVCTFTTRHHAHILNMGHGVHNSVVVVATCGPLSSLNGVPPRAQVRAKLHHPRALHD
eukprot:m.6907 g.6907  ORF g.6907 m.6907 type:complete len:92 (-) comp5274_c0_seq2:158-433(-)